MEEKEGLLAYSSKKIDTKGLRASQRAILEVAEKSVEAGELDTGVDLYTKLLSNDKIPRTTKVKFEKNINRIMTRVQKTIKVAQQIIPQELEIDYDRINEEGKFDLQIPDNRQGGSGGRRAGEGIAGGEQGLGQGGSAEEGTGAGQGGSAEEGTGAGQSGSPGGRRAEDRRAGGGQGGGAGLGEGQGAGLGEGQGAGLGAGLSEGQGAGLSEGQGAGLSEGQDAGLSEGQDAGLGEGQGAGLGGEPGVDVITEVEEIVNVVYETAPSPIAPPSASQVKMNDVNIQGVNLKNVNLEGLGTDPGDKIVSENLFSDAIDYTIDKITENVERLIESKVPKEFKKHADVDKADFRRAKSHDWEEADDFQTSVHDNEVSLTEGFFEKLDDLTKEMGDLNENIEVMKPTFIQTISDHLFPELPPDKKSLPPKKISNEEYQNMKQNLMDHASSLEGIAEDVTTVQKEADETFEEVKGILKDQSISQEGMAEVVGSVDSVEDTDLSFIKDALLKQAESLEEAADEVESVQTDSQETLEDIKGALLQQVSNQQNIAKNFGGGVPKAESNLKEIEQALFKQEDSGSEQRETSSSDGAESFVSGIDEGEVQLGDNFFDTINSLQSDMAGIKSDVSNLKEQNIGDISDTLFPDVETKQTEPLKQDAFQENIKLAGDFFDKVNLFTDRLQQGGVEHNVDQALAFLDEEETGVSDKESQIPKLEPAFEDSLKELNEKVEATVLDHQMSEIVDKELGLDSQDVKELASGMIEATQGLQEAAEGIKDAAEGIKESAKSSEQHNEAFDKEMDAFKNLVDMLEKEKEKREESESALADFEKSLEDIQAHLKEQEEKVVAQQQELLKQQQQVNQQEQFIEDFKENPLEIFQAGSEETIEDKRKLAELDENYNKMQYFPDSEVSEEEEDFVSLDTVMDEDLSYVKEYTKDDATRDQSKENFHEDIDPTFIPSPYNTDYDYQNEDGFFQDISGAPVIVAGPVIISDEAMQKALDESAHKQLEEATAQVPEIPQGTPMMMAAPPQYAPQYAPQASAPQQQQPKRPRKTLKDPIQLTYDFRNLFQNKYYRKYRDMLNEAATLVAEKKLDEALEFYYVIQDQNIPHSFRIMIKQNIRDIEETIVDTFRYSDTIVKVGEAGEVSRLKVIEAEQNTYEVDGVEHHSVTSNEIAFHED